MSKKQWIITKLSEINRLQDSWKLPGEAELLTVRGKEFPLVVQKGEKSVEDAIWRILMDEGRKYLPSRVYEMAAIHKFEISGVKIRKMKTRWGSCTAKNSINLNSWLMMLPDHLADYVILHELTHTNHRDHSRKFWEALDRITKGSSKALRKELKTHRIMLIYPEN